MDHDCEVCGSSRDGRKLNIDGLYLVTSVVNLDGISVPVEIYGDLWIEKYLCPECLRKVIVKVKTPIQAKLWGKI
jgi:hypothetical protein